MFHSVQHGENKYQRFRARRAQQGMKLLRVWVPDPAAPGFIEEAKRQAAVLKSRPEESEALDIIEANTAFDDWTA